VVADVYITTTAVSPVGSVTDATGNQGYNASGGSPGGTDLSPASTFVLPSITELTAFVEQVIASLMEEVASGVVFTTGFQDTYKTGPTGVAVMSFEHTLVSSGSEALSLEEVIEGLPSRVEDPSAAAAKRGVSSSAIGAGVAVAVVVGGALVVGLVYKRWVARRRAMAYTGGANAVAGGASAAPSSVRTGASL
jgi:hypothetical protein